MKKAFVRAASGVASLGVLLGFVAAPASADTDCWWDEDSCLADEYDFADSVTSVKASAQTQVASRSSKVTVTIKFDPPAGDYSFDDPEAYVSSDIGYSSAYVDLEEVKPGVLRGSTQIDNYDQPGKWWIDYSVWVDVDPALYYYDWDYASVDYAGRFTVKRNVNLKFNATPEPAKIGKTQTLKGTVKGLKGTSPWSIGYSGLKKKVKFYFDPAGSKPKRYMGSTTANGRGEFSKKFTVTGSGTWYAKFEGGNQYITVTKSDYVKATR
ncbi:hypothetical protein [Demequina rhizosphaerae]|uniref:hypothetical protein n=1 Tax=Demequina rhizosphaerae TaxID=1638985 RepID=UPI000783FB83|nr:hypothetical protein [Demequina rhizosphaerae]